MNFFQISFLNKYWAGISIVFCLISLAIILLYTPPTHVVGFNENISLPIKINGEHPYKNTITKHQVIPKIKIHLHSSSPVSITVANKTVACKNKDCVFITKLYDDVTDIKINSSTGSTITDLKITTVKYERITTISSIPSSYWSYVFICLLLLILLCRIFQSRTVATQWIIIFFTTAFLIINDPVFTGILYIYLYLIYKLRNFVSSHSNKIRYLFLYVITAIFFLLLFKYGKNGIYSIFANPGEFNLLMPLGISYFIIRLIDTQLKWFRSDCLDLSFREFLLFIIFPGTLIAGPIDNIKGFYKNKLVTIQTNDYAYGLSRFLIGAFKKIVIADSILYPMIHGKGIGEFLWNTSASVNTIITAPYEAAGGDIFAFALTGLLFAYIDFSAYSDMAIGISRLLGYRVPENFNFPILAENIRDYWQRWHMSLSGWAFRNIYFPLLVKTQNAYIPIFATMTTIGIWHAFSLSWLSWALHHATGMTVVALFQKHIPANTMILTILRPLRTIMTIVFASMGFVFVYFDDFNIAKTLYISYWKWIFFLN